MSRRRGLICRAFALLVALVSVETQIASVVHLATTRHVRCAEHDELIDVGSGTAVAQPADPRPVLADNDSRPDHGHHHCDFVALGRARALVAASARLLPNRLPVTLAAWRADVPPARVGKTPIFRLAPKTSPPA